MKVLDLQCAHLHLFEGWFGSEEDYLSQRERGLIECPVCADSVITKRLSAPRLNLSRAQTPSELSGQPNVVEPSAAGASLQAAWMEVSRKILANTDDVGTQFAEEARKIHYGEIPERGIRGQASVDETKSLIEEGIAVMPLLLPEGLKGPLQ
jgi:hypothetical protein